MTPDEIVEQSARRRFDEVVPSTGSPITGYGKNLYVNGVLEGHRNITRWSGALLSLGVAYGMIVMLVITSDWFTSMSGFITLPITVVLSTAPWFKADRWHPRLLAKVSTW